MKKTFAGYSYLLVICFLLSGLAGCTETPKNCPPPVQVDLSQMRTYYTNDSVPFQFPLEDLRIFEAQEPFSTEFATYGMTTRGYEHHAAEDILQPAGTPVYAIADGNVSFSGRMDGYGWLVIIDHPQANIYSLYGHLSPSRWSIEKGSVGKGELIGYLGDSDENGGTKEHPMRTHLHLGVRVGQRTDYPGNWDWRWMAGWVKPCPQDLGWLQPSLVVASQDLHIGDSYKRTARFLSIWWFDILFIAFYIIGAGGMLFFALKQKKIGLLFIFGIILAAAGWIFLGKGMNSSYAVFFMAVVFFLIGIYQLIQKRKGNLN
jgi:hypothetical protein